MSNSKLIWKFVLIYLIIEGHRVLKIECQGSDELEIAEDRKEFIFSDIEKIKGTFCPAKNMEAIEGSFTLYRCYPVANIFFSVDCSGEISLDNWQSRILPYIINIANLFEMGVDGLRIGMGFSQRKYITVASLDEEASYNKKILKKKIKQNKFIRPASERDLYSDLQYVLSTQFNLPGVRANVQNILIWIITGDLKVSEINDPRLSTASIEAVYGQNLIKSIVLYFGTVDHEILHALARCAPNVPNCANVIRFTTADAFESYDSLTIAICNQVPLNELCSYSRWGDCKGICGRGVRTKSLERKVPPPQLPYLSKTCEDQGYEIEIDEECDLPPCSVDAHCGDFVEAGSCSKECGEGKILFRRDSYNVPAARNGGRSCEEQGIQEDMLFDCMGTSCVNCKEWGDYGGCSAICGNGLKIRTRKCDNGLDIQYTECGTQECDAGCIWELWGRCSNACGPGYSTLVGECNSKKIEQHKLCENKPCQSNCQWEEWGRCPKDCGEANRERIWSCNKNYRSIESCNLMPCPKNCVWKEWGDCSSTCGIAQKTREGVCDNLDTVEYESCDSLPCDCLVDHMWGPCNKSCGNGIQTKNAICNGLQTTLSKPCNLKPCPTNCVTVEEPCTHKCGYMSIWRKQITCDEGVYYEEYPCRNTNCPCIWQEWGSCSVSCGVGEVRREGLCYGNSIFESKICTQADCPVECISWDWTVCSESCGDGKRTRIKTCNGVDSIIVEDCNLGDCPVAVVCNWHPWGMCDKICGEGKQRRIGECGGVPTNQVQPCSITDCPRGCFWLAWDFCIPSCGQGVRRRASSCADVPDELEDCHDQVCDPGCKYGLWGDCTASCGGGTRRRSAICLKLDTYEIEKCGLEPCPVCNDWENWGTCSVSCGTGVETRRCNEFEKVEERECVIKCPKYKCSSWSDWGSCSKECGNGYKRSSMMCNDRIYSKVSTCTGHQCPLTNKKKITDSGSKSFESEASEGALSKVSIALIAVGSIILIGAIASASAFTIYRFGSSLSQGIKTYENVEVEPTTHTFKDSKKKVESEAAYELSPDMSIWGEID